MNQNNQICPSLSELFGRLYEHNRQGGALAGLGIRTSADIFEAAQKEHEKARDDRQFAREWNRRQGGVSSRAVVAITEKDMVKEGRVVESTGRRTHGKRKCADTMGEPPPKRTKTVDSRERSEVVAQEEPVVEPTIRGPEGCAIQRGIDEGLGEFFNRIDVYNRENVTRVGLDIRTSADIFEACQKEYEQERVEKYHKRQAQGQGRAPSPGGVVAVAKNVAKDIMGEARPKCTKIVVRRERSEAEQMEDLAHVLRHLEEEFEEKERLSREQAWCVPIPLARKVSTVQKFYKAFHDKNTLPIYTCKICYLKFGRTELQEVGWDAWMASGIEKRNDSPFKCGSCFPVGQRILACVDCVRHLGRGALSRAAQLHTQLGCEHMFPDELKGLTPVEEKLIALNSCYGFITKYSVPKGQRQNATYPKHIKGHITVFPNNVQELATNVLPHPLLRVMDEIHVAWQGREKPAPSDLSALLSVRRRVVERALVWLKRHNPLYANIHIDTAEMDRWEAPEHGVPSQVYGRLERNEPSAWEKARTGQVVPPTERGLEEDGPTDIREIMATLCQGRDMAGNGHEAEEETYKDGEENDHVTDFDSATDAIHEISSSGMFALDAPPDISDTDKLQYVCDALGQKTFGCQTGRSSWAGSTQVRHGHAASEPYIVVSRGEEFADSFDTRFFAKTFPTLFPVGNGGPRQAEESITVSTGVVEGPDATAQNLVSSRNMNLETWARLVLQRHGGRFANHHVFAFLIFNMMVKWRNRRVSMLSVTRKNFREVERVVRSLSAEQLERAKEDLKDSGKSNDEAVNKLLTCLSLYGLRQPMSREDRLSMRRKIKSLIIRHGIPAIWFTLNPNDIMNPVKLRLAAYRGREPEEAEAFLTSLDMMYKRVRLAISDPISSAIFFHREISMFFEHYVQAGKDSVFGRISQYFGAVETNERGALHVHGLLWLHGNMNLSSMLKDVVEGDQAAYQEAIIQYVDSVFTEVSFVILFDLPNDVD